jgi:glutamate dehydrogenase
MTSTKAGAGNPRLLSALSAALSDALLPGDEPFAKADLADAAGFVLAAATEREAGEAKVALESVTGPVGARLMRIAVINDDMPFLVDSIAAAVSAQGLAIDRLVHPLIGAERDTAGKLLAVKDGAPRESAIYLETSRADARTRSAVQSALKAALADVRVAVADWPRMQAAMASDAEMLEQDAKSAEGAALLRWLHDGMLTQLGHVTRQRDGRQTGALGICRKSAKDLLSDASYDRAFAWFDKRGHVPLVIKTNRVSNVHRRVPLDLFLVPHFADEKGGKKASALSIHAGIWTSAALATPPEEVPWLRKQLDTLMARFDFAPQSHDGKALVHALTALPHDLMIAFDEADLTRVATSMMSLVDRPRSRLVLARAPLDRHLYAFAWLPRDVMSNAVRDQIAAMLTKAASAELLDWSLEIEGNTLAMLRFVLDIRNGSRPPDEAALDAALQAMVRGWSEAVEAELAVKEDPARAAAIAGRFAEAFPSDYRNAYGPIEAARDIERLRNLGGEEAEGQPLRDARLYRLQGDPGSHLRLKLYQRGGAIALSDAVPMLENFGFRVLGEMQTMLGGGELGAIHDFTLALAPGLETDALLTRAADIEGAIASVLNSGAENDAFNRLIASVALSARETNWLRAWYRYLRQAGLGFALVTVVDALQAAPRVARGLIALFLARHDPSYTGDRATAEAVAEEEMRDGLLQVSAINDDRLLRQYRSFVEAVLRTNAFVPAGEAALAFKIDSAGVPGLPLPVPWREIFVYSPRVEGIHLRAGPVARGGIRWSDRRDDFRTEVLGLMKAQRVKNAVIVPTGAKGGFYPKLLPNPAQDREGWLAEGKASYQLFIRSLLSITDNLVGNKVRHPKGVVLRDADDPYFVVAADKGTASYSDTANAIAEEYDFWLDDAFASGGSKGYDHKAMGITARGAWMSVQRHFLELGVDVQTDPVRVVGCGDMSGDVFGNGMLLSKTLKIVAAFDHRHVFLDPDPDPTKSWAERNRMFALPRSSWDDYDKKLISKGGGVYPRAQKSIPLSSEIRAALGIDAETLDPDSLITAILKAPVDLLWFGGIGTYVKAAAENNIQVGDPANDALRIDGRDVGAKVIGEGANLGCTQAGRIEFAAAGGRNNTDFIDNSAGVDCSDNEVNIKIALASAKRDERLTEPARVKLLSQMTDDVAALVLEDNRLQSLSLSIGESGGAAALGSQVRLIEMLEERGQLDRRTEGLAANDVLLRRGADGQGLTRPELSVLLSSAKLALQAAIEDSPLPDDPALTPSLTAAFPSAMQKKFRQDIENHRLRREIIATKLCNRMVNRMGMIHPFELVEEEGATLAQVAAAFAAAEQLFDMPKLWQVLETTAMPERARIMLFRRAAGALRSQIADLLRAGGGTYQTSTLIADLSDGVHDIAKVAASLLSSEGRAQSSRLCEELAALGAPADAAAKVAHLYDMDGAVGIALLARSSGLSARPLTEVFVDIGTRLGLDWAQTTAAQLRPSDPWDRLLVSGLARDFQQMRIDFLRRLLGKKGNPAITVAKWAEAQGPAIRQFRTMIARGQAAVPTTPAMLAQIAGQARNLLAR